MMDVLVLFTMFDKMFWLRYHSMLGVSRRCVLVLGGENFKSRHNISSRLQVCLYRDQD